MTNNQNFSEKIAIAIFVGFVGLISAIPLLAYSQQSQPITPSHPIAQSSPPPSTSSPPITPSHPIAQSSPPPSTSSPPITPSHPIAQSSPPPSTANTSSSPPPTNTSQQPASSSQSASQNSFTATLNGNVVQPPVNTPATGTAKFQLNSNGTISYEVDAKNLDKVIDGSIEYKNGTEVVSLINPYATTSTGFNQVKSVYPTGLINGKLTSGVITSDKLLGGFLGKNVTDLSKSMKDGSLNVVIRTQPHQDGEIAGTIVPSK